MPVSDVGAAAEFYTELFGFSGERVSDGRHYFNCKGTILACYDPVADGDGGKAVPLPDHVYFAVDNLEGVFDVAKNLDCKRIDDSIAEQPWGERCFYATDPFGNRLCFVDRKTMFTGTGSK